MMYPVLASVSGSYPRAERQVAYVLLTRPPLSSVEQVPPYSARLACIRHAASVRPEPGSNSPLKLRFRGIDLSRKHHVLVKARRWNCQITLPKGIRDFRSGWREFSFSIFTRTVQEQRQNLLACRGSSNHYARLG